MNCEDKFFHWVVYKIVFNIEVINATNNKEVIVQDSLRYGDYKKFGSNDLDVIIKKIQKKDFLFSQTLSLTMKVYSSF